MTMDAQTSEGIRIKPLEFISSESSLSGAPFWTARTLVGEFVYGQDLSGTFYWQGTSDQYGGANVSSLNEARAAAIQDYEDAVRRNPVVGLLEVGQ